MTDQLRSVSSDFSTQTTAEKDLVSYVMGYVDEWKTYRDQNYEDAWNTYYRMWRGIWHENDRTRKSERSKLISPALQQAIEMQVAEMEEATFMKKLWFDLSDDVMDEHREEIEVLRDRLLEDMNKAGVEQAITETYLNGAIYGTGISKIVVKDVQVTELTPEGPVVKTKVQVQVVPVHPEEFVIDPVARSVNDALGCAHDTIRPRHEIESMKDDGVYMDKDLGSWDSDIDVSAKGEAKANNSTDVVRLTEWHGLVPRRMLDNLNLEEDEELELFYDEEEYYEDELVESIVTIANDGVLLRAVENPFIMKDRSVVAYQHDKVPNRFWGRGVAEKGINAQKALDAELRGRIDAMALAIHPMIGVDATRLPRGVQPTVSPGKTILTNGAPGDVLKEFKFSAPGQATFAQGSELERMISMATGSQDTAVGIGSQPRNATASGMSMLQTTSIRRTKRVMQNIERDYLRPLVQKVAWRYMQFDNERYPMDDYDFVPRSSMGMMAREFEQAQMTNLLTMMPQNSPAFGLVLSQILENSSGEDKEEMKKMIKELFTPKQPSPEEVQLKQTIQQLEVKKLMAEINEIEARAAAQIAQAETRYKDSQVNEFEAKTDRLEAEAKIQDNELDRRMK